MKQEKKIESTKNKIKELDCQFDIQLKFITKKKLYMLLQIFLLLLKIHIRI